MQKELIADPQVPIKQRRIKRTPFEADGRNVVGLAVDDDFDARRVKRDEILITVHPIPKIHVAWIGLLRVDEKQFEQVRRKNVERVVADSMAEDAIKAIIEAARTGEIGDGRVFVLPVGESYKIRTGEREL